MKNEIKKRQIASKGRLAIKENGNFEDLCLVKVDSSQSRKTRTLVIRA